jgi:hypothetical protein
MLMPSTARAVTIDDSLRGVTSVEALKGLRPQTIVSPPLSGLHGSQDLEYGPGGGASSWGMDRLRDGYIGVPVTGAEAAGPGYGSQEAGPPSASESPFSALTPDEGLDVIADGVYASASEDPFFSMRVPGQVERPPQLAPDQAVLTEGAVVPGGPGTFGSASVRSAMAFRGKGGGGGGSRMDAPGATVARGLALQAHLDSLFEARTQLSVQALLYPWLKPITDALLKEVQLGITTTVDAEAQARREFDRMKGQKHWGKTYDQALAREKERQEKAAALAAAAAKQVERGLTKRWEKREGLLGPLSYSRDLPGTTLDVNHAKDRVRHWKEAEAGIARAREAGAYITQQRALFHSLRRNEFHPRTKEETAQVAKLQKEMADAYSLEHWNAQNAVHRATTPEERAAALERVRLAERRKEQIKDGFKGLVRIVDEALKAAGVARKALDKASRDRKRLARNGASKGARDTAEAKQKAKQDELDRALLDLAKAMAKLWAKTHPPEPEKAPPVPGKDGNIPRTSIAFPPEICAVKNLCECGSPSSACDCKKDETCQKCKMERVPPPGDKGVKGLGNQLMAAGLQRANQLLGKDGQPADVVRENIYFTGEPPFRSPADTPSGGVGGHGPAIGPFGSPGGVIPYFATPNHSPQGAPVPLQQAAVGPNEPPPPPANVLDADRPIANRILRWFVRKTADPKIPEGTFNAIFDAAMNRAAKDLFGSLPTSPGDYDPNRLLLRGLEKTLGVLDEGLTRLNDVVDRVIGTAIAGGTGLLSHALANQVWMINPDFAEDLHRYADAALGVTSKQFSLIDDAFVGHRLPGEPVSGKRVGDFLARMGVANLEASVATVAQGGVLYLRSQAANSSGEQSALFTELADTLEEFANSSSGEAKRSLSEAWQAFSTSSDITASMSDDEKLKHVILRELLNPVNWIGGALASKALEKFRRLLNLRRIARARPCECPPKAIQRGSKPLSLPSGIVTEGNVSVSRAEQALVDGGLDATHAKDFVGSGEGALDIVSLEPGMRFKRYAPVGGDAGKGYFVTIGQDYPSAGAAKHALDLRASPVVAQDIEITKSVQGVASGIKGGAPGTPQVILPTKDCYRIVREVPIR